MAAIQNARDVLLQAAPVRLVMVPIDPTLIPGLPETIGAVRGVKLTAPSNVFQIAVGGAASPAANPGARCRGCRPARGTRRRSCG